MHTDIDLLDNTIKRHPWLKNIACLASFSLIFFRSLSSLLCRKSFLCPVVLTLCGIGHVCHKFVSVAEFLQLLLIKSQLNQFLRKVTAKKVFNDFKDQVKGELLNTVYRCRGFEIHRCVRIG